MGKICRICGKPVVGDVLKHYQEKHFNIYVANKSKIESYPGAFVVSEKNVKLCNAIKQEVRKNIEARQVVADANFQKEHSFNKKKMRTVLNEMNKHPEEQTYRGRTNFVCDVCGKSYSHGKVIYASPIQKLHLCYACYKHAKERSKAKRGNKHVFINTPM